MQVFFKKTLKYDVIMEISKTPSEALSKNILYIPHLVLSIKITSFLDQLNTPF